MQSIKAMITDLNDMILQGKLIGAFEKYYHEEVSMQENAMPPTIGKKANLDRENQFLSNIIDFRTIEVMGVATGENISYVTWKYDYTHKEWGVRNYTQVSVQHWQEGKIIREQFFYGN